jgi:hypothetical protein
MRLLAADGRTDGYLAAARGLSFRGLVGVENARGGGAIRSASWPSSNSVVILFISRQHVRALLRDN